MGTNVRSVKPKPIPKSKREKPKLATHKVVYTAFEVEMDGTTYHYQLPKLVSLCDSLESERVGLQTMMDKMQQDLPELVTLSQTVFACSWLGWAGLGWPRPDHN